MLASLWLAAASLFFYGWWDVRFVGLLLGSILFNYSAGYLIGQAVTSQLVNKTKVLLFCSVAANLILLGYFKYANFFADNLNQLAGTSFPIGDVILPLGISFFTFTQIAFLVDTYQGKVKEYNFAHYALFVTYFPHLIAGPVLHHKQMMPQFAKPETYHINWGNVAIGLTIFILGLAKKVLIADNLAEFATPIFDVVKNGGQPMLIEAWIGALSYTLQLYFDFSGYSDMAIGLSLIFSVRLPINFDSPYKATSIIEFWRRWHMTLSTFLRDYLYFPLGGNRKGSTRRYVNLMSTMLLGGLWHGAGWTFVIWGGLHGLYLMINHLWREFKQHMGWSDGGRYARFSAGGLTFLAVVVGWVFFRANNFTSAWVMLSGMSGVNGVLLPDSLDAVAPLSHVPGAMAVISILIGLVMVWGFPNVRQMLISFKPAWEDMVNKRTPATLSRNWLARKVVWQPNTRHAWIVAAIFILCIFNLTKVSEFLYFQF